MTVRNRRSFVVVVAVAVNLAKIVFEVGFPFELPPTTSTLRFRQRKRKRNVSVQRETMMMMKMMLTEAEV